MPKKAALAPAAACACIIGACLATPALPGTLPTSRPFRTVADDELGAGSPIGSDSRSVADRVVIRRTAYGVPHILAQDFEAAGYGMGWAQMEDYGLRVPRGLVRARGQTLRIFGPDSGSVEVDARARWVHARATAAWDSLPADVRDVYRGFAEGVNRYVERHRDSVPTWVPSDFSGADVSATDILTGAWGRSQRIARMLDARATGSLPDSVNPDVGSNAWALAPSRTTSGHAILLRNPHLSWDAGYYEAQLTVPGEVDFYGDFRIGGPFGIVGGFNRRLGWATTNNYPDTDELYALDVDPAAPDHYLFGGNSLPVERVAYAIEVKNGPGLSTQTTELWFTPLGPVVHRAHGKVYVLKAGAWANTHIGEQFLAMMRATSLDQWKQAMRLLARGASNFTYADADGHIFQVWNAALPELPGPSGGDTVAIPVHAPADVWSRLVPWDSLPHRLDPKGGYLHSENDPFWFMNLQDPIRPDEAPWHVPAPMLRLRSQHALALIGGSDKLSLEDVVRRKHSYRMLLAERVTDDLVRAVKAASPSSEAERAIAMIERWDRTAAPDSRGGVLFETWWSRYVATAPKAEATPASSGFDAQADSLFAEPWSESRPTSTPRGLSSPLRAAAAFEWAVAETARRWGSWDVAWGDVHRVRIGDVDVPVGGCSGDLGCFRVLWYREDADGKLEAAGGDGWILAVEFGRTPRAYSVLAYGESADPASPHHADQAEMFAQGRLKRVAFTEPEIRRTLEQEYRPGEAGSTTNR